MTGLVIGATVESSHRRHRIRLATGGGVAHDRDRATVKAKAAEEAIRELILHTDRVAEIHNTLRLGMAVELESYEAIAGILG